MFITHELTAGTQRCYNVVLRLILGREVKQPIFYVEIVAITLLISTSVKTTYFQRCFNVRFQP